MGRLKTDIPHPQVSLQKRESPFTSPIPLEEQQFGLPGRLRSSGLQEGPPCLGWWWLGAFT